MYNVFFSIIKEINTVFYQHLCNWIIYGNLVDPFNEFFICDGKVADTNFLYPAQATVLCYIFTKLRIAHIFPRKWSQKSNNHRTFVNFL